jgi:hypothetical protein
MILRRYVYLLFIFWQICFCRFLLIQSVDYVQSVGLPKLNSTQIRRQEVHSNGPVLDDALLSDPEVRTPKSFPSEFIAVKSWIIKFQ